MRNLDLIEMENIEGGGHCNGMAEEAAFAVSGSGLIFAIATVAAVSNPIGWIGLGFAAASMAFSSYACMD